MMLLIFEVEFIFVTLVLIVWAVWPDFTLPQDSWRIFLALKMRFNYWFWSLELIEERWRLRLHRVALSQIGMSASSLVLSIKRELFLFLWILNKKIDSMIDGLETLFELIKLIVIIGKLSIHEIEHEFFEFFHFFIDVFQFII